MPIYEYRCNHCGNELEAIQKLSESPLTFCPACETDGLKKKISAAVFRLKGGGWYETDFKSDKKKNVAGDDDGGSKEKDNGQDKAQQQANRIPVRKSPQKTGRLKSGPRTSLAAIRSRAPPGQRRRSSWNAGHRTMVEAVLPCVVITAEN